jgi:hypothetical protein
MYRSKVGTLDEECDAVKVGRHGVTNVSPSWTWAAGEAISRAKRPTPETRETS